MDDVKIIYTNGDSWTAGDIVDPEIFGDRLEHVMHPDNDQYRLPRVWPHILGDMLGKEVLNNSYAGCSNDGIVRKVLEDIPSLLLKYRPEEVCVIIGFSSPERKDFFYRDENRGTWDTLYPAELGHWESPDKEVTSFYKTYVTKYWNIEEYIHRFISQVLFLSNYLDSKGIQHYFFNAFYEHKDLVLEKSPDKHNIKNSPTLFSYIDNFYASKHRSWLSYIGLNNTVKEFYSVYNKKFIKTTFSEYLVTLEEENKDRERLLEYHPTHEGHQEWARFLSTNITASSNFDKLVFPEKTTYFVTDTFNQIDVNKPPKEILEIYSHVKEIQETDPDGYPLHRPLFHQSRIPRYLGFVEKTIEEVPEDEPYFYAVTIHHHNFLAARHLNLLPDYVLRDLKSGRCSLILDNTMEGDNIETFLVELYNSIDKLGIVPQKVFYITSNLIADEYFNEWYIDTQQALEKVNIISYPYNIEDIKSLIENKHLPEEVNVEQLLGYKRLRVGQLKTFLKVNRTGRPERNLFMLYINKLNLYPKFKISFPKFYADYYSSNMKRFFPEYCTDENVESLKLKLPFDIDQSDEDNHGPPGVGKGKFNADLPFDPQHYKDTFISVVMCAFPMTKGACHLHSSTFNPMYCGHPIISFGPVGHLKKLRELGFKTFNEWWDESYDEIEFDWDRLKAIFKIVEELSQKPNSEIFNMYGKMQKVLQHNVDVIKNFDGKLFLRKKLLYGDNI